MEMFEFLFSENAVELWFLQYHKFLSECGKVFFSSEYQVVFGGNEVFTFAPFMLYSQLSKL